jgi:hypothetical protein
MKTDIFVNSFIVLRILRGKYLECNYKQEITQRLVSFGSLYVLNPDLVKRFGLNAGYNEPDRSTFYGEREKDYPILN